jgi:hypothetical protein
MRRILTTLGAGSMLRRAPSGEREAPPTAPAEQAKRKERERGRERLARATPAGALHSLPRASKRAREASAEGAREREASAEGARERKASAESAREREASAEGAREREASAEGARGRSAEGVRERKDSAKGAPRAPSRSDQASARLSCHCRKSKCLKLYCECFAVRAYCADCECFECANTPAGEPQRGAAVEQVLKNRPLAFQPKIVASTSLGGAALPMAAHVKGCFCKKTNCLKKYCECFHGRVLCGPTTCKCTDCRNFLGSVELKRRRSGDKEPLPPPELPPPLSPAPAPALRRRKPLGLLAMPQPVDAAQQPVDAAQCATHPAPASGPPGSGSAKGRPPAASRAAAGDRASSGTTTLVARPPLIIRVCRRSAPAPRVVNAEVNAEEKQLDGDHADSCSVLSESLEQQQQPQGPQQAPLRQLLEQLFPVGSVWPLLAFPQLQQVTPLPQSAPCSPPPRSAPSSPSPPSAPTSPLPPGPQSPLRVPFSASYGGAHTLAADSEPDRCSSSPCDDSSYDSRSLSSGCDDSNSAAGDIDCDLGCGLAAA